MSWFFPSAYAFLSIRDFMRYTCQPAFPRRRSVMEADRNAFTRAKYRILLFSIIIDYENSTKRRFWILGR
jgi:hypothetical protein